MKYIVDEAISRSDADAKAKPLSMIQNDEELVSVLEELTTIIRVIGCGGGGSNTIDRLSDCGIQGAELFAINTDAQHLLHINADRRFLMPPDHPRTRCWKPSSHRRRGSHGDHR